MHIYICVCVSEEKKRTILLRCISIGDTKSTEISQIENLQFLVKNNKSFQHCNSLNSWEA